MSRDEALERSAVYGDGCRCVKEHTGAKSSFYAASWYVDYVFRLNWHVWSFCLQNVLQGNLQ